MKAKAKEGKDSNGEDPRLSKRVSVSQYLGNNLSSRPFNWKKGCFEGDENGKLWHQLLLHALIGPFIVSIPLIIYNSSAFNVPYSLFDESFPETLYWPLELIRWSIFLAVGYTCYIITNICAVLMVYCTYGVAKARGTKVNHRVQEILDQMLFLRSHVARFSASLGLFVAAHYLFPLSLEERNISLFLKQKDKKDPEKIDLVGIENAIKSYSQAYSFQFFVERSSIILLIFSTLLLLEKIALHNIASYFYYRTCGKRMAQNHFDLKIYKKLKGKLSKNTEIDPEQKIRIIFDMIVPSHRNVMTPIDLVCVLSVEEATAFFEGLDVENTGDINYTQFHRAITNMYEERDQLSKGVLEQHRIIAKLDYLLVMMVFLASLVLSTAIFQVSLEGALTTFAAIGTFMYLVASGTLKATFDSIVFVIFTHPFDVGDKVMIKTESYVVKELGLWCCSFIGPGGRLTYFTNTTLCKENIINYRRSPFQSETITIKVHPKTSTQCITRLEERLNAFLKNNPRDFIAPIQASGYNIVGEDHMELSFQLKHRGNFQDGLLKSTRTKMFMECLRRELDQVGIVLSPPFWGALTSK